MTTGSDLIAAERVRQIEVEGYDAAHDADHDPRTLVSAAVCYLSVNANHCGCSDPDYCRRALHRGQHTRVPDGWPWSVTDWKPSDDPVRNLVKAGALLAAARDRVGHAIDQLAAQS